MENGLKTTARTTKKHAAKYTKGKEHYQLEGLSSAPFKIAKKKR